MRSFRFSETARSYGKRSGHYMEKIISCEFAPITAKKRKAEKTKKEKNNAIQTN